MDLLIKDVPPHQVEKNVEFLSKDMEKRLKDDVKIDDTKEEKEA